MPDWCWPYPLLYGLLFSWVCKLLPYGGKSWRRRFFLALSKLLLLSHSGLLLSGISFPLFCHFTVRLVRALGDGDFDDDFQHSMIIRNEHKTTTTKKEKKRINNMEDDTKEK